MKFRFIEYHNEIYIVVGITYDHWQDLCFIATLLDKHSKSLHKSVLNIDVITIPLSEAKEITDRNKLLRLMVLYG